MNKWTIKKGSHYSLSNFWKRFLPKIGCGPVTYKFKFQKDAWYPYETIDDCDINKLAGFGFGNHHTNSVRIGWLPEFSRPGYIGLYFYNYNEKIRTIRKFADIQVDFEHTLTISFIKEINYLTFDMKGRFPATMIEIFVLPEFKIGYFLWPYFGGNGTAPKKLDIFLERL